MRLAAPPSSSMSHRKALRACKAPTRAEPNRKAPKPTGQGRVGRLEGRLMNQQYDAYVTAALFDRSGIAAFALGDGTVRFESGETIEAHGDGAVLSACAHPGGEGLLTGGDDGRVVWSR